MGNIKRISFLFIVLSLGFQAQAQRCGACIIKGDIVIDFAYSFEQRYEMNSVMKFPQAIYVAHYLDSCGISLDQRVTVKKQDLDCCSSCAVDPMMYKTTCETWDLRTYA